MTSNCTRGNDREIESLVHTVWIFSEDIGMQFGTENCATIKLQRGKVKHTEGIVLPNAQVICDVKEDGYKYLAHTHTHTHVCPDIPSEDP